VPIGALAAVAAVIAVAIVAIFALGSGGGKGGAAASKGEQALGSLTPVPENHVTGSGSARVVLKGNVVTVTIDTNGLLNGAPHALHIHAGGRGVCPPASAARPHNGHLAISTTDGIPFYGPPITSLTTSGDTSTASILAFARFPSVGDIRYVRTITVPAPVAAYIRQNNAVIVAHGINYDGSGIYDGILDRSELNKNLPATATAPALCGPLKATQAVAVRGGRSRTTVYTAALNLETSGPVAPATDDGALTLTSAYSWFCHIDGTALGSPTPGREQPVAGTA
jgi:hypothetical protein